MSSLKKQFVSGVFYTAIAKYIGLIIQLVITGILSRILTPNDFGVVAIATVFIVFFNLLSDVGIGVAVIQNKTLSKDDINNIFTFSIYIGLALALIFFMLSYYIASIYNNPILNPICKLLSLNVLFVSLNVVPNGLLLKEKQFKFIAFRTLSIQIVCGTFGIIAAFMDFGVYALLIHTITSAIIVFIVNYIKNPLIIKWKLNKKALNKIFTYSAYQFLFNFINYFSRNLDTLFIGKFLSPAILGYYDKAYRLMLLPIENLTHVLSPVLHPLFSDFQLDKKRIFDGYLRVVKFLALIGFPLAAFLHFTASEIIIIIFGQQWTNAIPVFKILSWSVGIQVVLSSSGAIFQAANNTRALFISGGLSAITMIIAICYGVFLTKNIEGTAYALVLAFAFNFIQCFYILIKTLHGSFLPFVKNLSTPIILFLLVMIGSLGYNEFLVIDNVFLSLCIKSVFVGILMIAGLYITGELKMIKTYIFSIIK